MVYMVVGVYRLSDLYMWVLFFCSMSATSIGQKDANNNLANQQKGLKHL